MKGKTALIMAIAPIVIAVVQFFTKDKIETKPIITVPVTVNVTPTKTPDPVSQISEKDKSKEETPDKEYLKNEQETHGDKSPILNNVNGNININYN